MQHKCKVTVIDKKLYPELQTQYCADPNSGACPIYNVGDEYIFERYGKADDFWHIGLGTLTGNGGGDSLAAVPPSFLTALRRGTPSAAISIQRSKAAALCAAG